MSYPTYDLAARIEISTLCNAKCPQCARTNSNGLEKYDWLEEKWVSLDTFKKWFPYDSISRIRTFYLTGSFGDPVTNPDLIDIVKYILDLNEYAEICINTNGSLKDEDYWLELGFAGGKNLTITFTIDGITQEQHEMYRVNTNLKKILKHMKLMSDFTLAKIRTITILFEHNENDIDKIIQLCKDHGSVECEITESNRFQLRDYWEYTYKNKIYNLKQVTKYRTPDTPKSYRKNRVIGLEYGKDKIICDSIRRKTLHINVDGDVYPCCYIGNEYTRALRYNNDKDNIIATDKDNNYPLIKELDNINLNNLSFFDIIKGKFYKEDLPESIKSYETAHKLCQFYCSY